MEELLANSLDEDDHMNEKNWDDFEKQVNLEIEQYQILAPVLSSTRS